MRKIVCAILSFVCLLLEAHAQVPVRAYSTKAFDPYSVTEYNGKLHFFARNDTVGTELWSYNGTGVPQLVGDIYPSTANGAYQNGTIASFKNKLYFPASTAASGAELFVYDGVNPPSLVADLVPGFPDSGPRAFVTYGSKMYFNAVSGTLPGRHSMYSYDGINPPVELNIPNFNGVAPYTVYNGKMYVAAYTVSVGAGIRLYVYDTTTSTLSIVRDVTTGASSPNPDPGHLVLANGKMYFNGRDSAQAYGNELYSYDGAHFTRLTDLAAGGYSGVDYYGIAYYKNAIFFAGAIDGQNFQLYKYNLATGNTSLVQTINPGANSVISWFKEFNGLLYFNALNVNSGSELWVTDSTTTNMVAELCPNRCDALPTDLIVYNNELYFAANDRSGLPRTLFRLSGATGVQNLSFRGKATLIPNPARGSATLLLDLEAGQKIRFTFTDAAGRQVFEKATADYPAGKTSIRIPAQLLTPGIYYYHLTDAGGRRLAAGNFVRE